MIKFFRKIRQQMIKDNNVGKYILYAIGEILLVVIGSCLMIASIIRVRYTIRGTGSTRHPGRKS